MNGTVRTTLALGTILVACGVACGGNTDNLPPPPPPPPPALTPSAPPPPPPPPPAADAGAAAATPAAPVTLTPMVASPDPAAPLPTVKITSPTKDQVIPADKAAETAVKLDVKNWQTATGSSHVHLILDNRPYKAIYDPKAPVKLSELTGGAALDEGQHVLVAFPSRANHESVKTKDALTVTQFWVGKKGEAKTDLKKPMLVYSRPKGEYPGDMASHVLVDFQLVNDALAEGKDHVHITVTGPGIDKDLTADVTKFGTPYYLDNLQNGEYALKLELLGGDNKVVAGPWNSTSRTIKIDRDAPTPPPMPPMQMGAQDAGAAPAAKPEKGATPKK